MKISKLISFLIENENLIKQPPDATSSPDYDPDFSPSPRPQTCKLRLSRGSIPWTLMSPPTRTIFIRWLSSTTQYIKRYKTQDREQHHKTSRQKKKREASWEKPGRKNLVAAPTIKRKRQ
ncbi:hypothetical protein AVEN_193166-1 [Araneus ventricosus]|uniref:Uncharacterized protein n=1 Tax=Araneus ventricosus TaxID=182803 RepID=A0A4Y2B326_ARAVE|nr:hypothetical protein AVEN_193166-1 [Araneus ventricosus]